MIIVTSDILDQVLQFELNTQWSNNEMSNLNWTKHFDPNRRSCLRYGRGSSRNKVLVITHYYPREVKYESRNFTKTLKKAKFYFRRIRSGYEEGLLYNDLTDDILFTNIVFASCGRLKRCVQCREASDFLDYLKEENIISSQNRFQYEVREEFLFTDKNGNPRCACGCSD